MDHDSGSAESEAQVALGPRVPDSNIRADLVEALRLDDSYLGEVFRRREAGQSLADVRSDIGDFAWNYDRGIRAAIDGDLPTAPGVIRGTTRIFRRLLRASPGLAPETEELLRENLTIMEARIAEPAARAAEVQVARQVTGEAEAQGTPGIYVYALPHYLNFPVDPDSGHTLMKVGRSDRDVIQRFRAQVRTTSLPEDPILLRIYVTGGEGSTLQERQFHDLLEAADHARSTARSGGTEWFMTSLRFLDAVANTIGLEIRTVFDPEAPE